MILNEGLQEGDLEGLVLNTISIDEYESKIDNTAIVIGFYISYKDPAYDLNKFIQKTNVDIIDTDISPAPTEDGYYIVFVELERDDDLYKNIIQLADTIKNLADIDSWNFTAYDVNEVLPLNEDNLKKYVSLSISDDEDNDDAVDDDNESVSESVIFDYFKESILDNLIIEGNEIIFIKNNYKLVCEFVDYGYISNTRKNNNLLNEAVVYNFNNTAISNKINSYVGSNWIVEEIGNYYSIRKDNNLELLVRINTWDL